MLTVDTIDIALACLKITHRVFDRPGKHSAQEIADARMIIEQAIGELLAMRNTLYPRQKNPLLKLFAQDQVRR